MHFLFCGVTQNKQSKLFGCQLNSRITQCRTVGLILSTTNEMPQKLGHTHVTLGNRGA